MKKRILSTLLAISLILTLFPTWASANTSAVAPSVTPDGDYWENMTRQEALDMLKAVKAGTETRDMVFFYYYYLDNQVASMYKSVTDAQQFIYVYVDMNKGAGQEGGTLKGEPEFEALFPNMTVQQAGLVYKAGGQCYAESTSSLPAANYYAVLAPYMRNLGLTNGATPPSGSSDPGPGGDNPPTPPGEDDGKNNLSAFRQSISPEAWEVLRLTNIHRMGNCEYRTDGGTREPLSVFAELQKSADERAKEIGVRYDPGHKRLDGRSWITIYPEVGIKGYTYAAENLASGQKNSFAAYFAWYNSTMHHRNMDSASAVHMGAGYAPANNWAENFVTNKCSFRDLKLSRTTINGQAGMDLETLLLSANIEVSARCLTHETSILPLIAAMCSGDYDPNCTQTQTLTVTYQGQKTTLTIKAAGDNSPPDEDECVHEWDTDTTSATCTEDGVTIKICTKCKAVEKAENGKAAGHNYENGVCTGCQKSPEAVVEKDIIEYTSSEVPVKTWDAETAKKYVEDELTDVKKDNKYSDTLIYTVQPAEDAEGGYFKAPEAGTDKKPAGEDGYFKYRITITDQSQTTTPDTQTGRRARAGTTPGETDILTLILPAMPYDGTGATAPDPGPGPQTYRVTFDANGGQVTPTSMGTYGNGKLIGTLPTPTRDGYTFDGWYTMREYGEKVNENKVYTRDTILYAHWTKNPVIYTVIFDFNDGTGRREMKPTTDTLTSSSFPAAAREGYVFDGWYTLREGGEKLTAVTRQDITLYAHWTKVPAEYAVKFEANGGLGEMAALTVKEGESFEFPECGFTAPEGKEFKSWRIKEENDVTENEDEAAENEENAAGTESKTEENAKEYQPHERYDGSVTGDMTFKAVWQDKEPEEPVTYAVVFDGGEGGGTMDAQTAAEGEAFLLPECGFTAPAGKEFKAWEIDGTEYAPGDVCTVTGDITVTAVWKDKGSGTPAVITITIDAGGGTGAMDNITVKEDGTFILPVCGFTAPAGMTFKSWLVNGAEYAAGAVCKYEDDMTVKAVWTAVHTPPAPSAVEEETYFISIPKSDGGEIIPNIRYAAYGARVSLGVHPDKGYELDSLTVKDIRGRVLTLREVSGNQYAFYMPSCRVTVEAAFIKAVAGNAPASPGDNNTIPGTSHTTANPDDEPFTGLGTPGVSGIVLNPAAMPFTDVPANIWYYNGVEYMWKHYLMSGVSDSQFAPGATTSRAMIWTVLARMNNVSTQVNSGAEWYERGMLWAREKGLTDGTNPTGNITREQLAAMLWRNAGRPSGSGADLSRFSDASDVSDYAKGAVQWAVTVGILNGSDGKLNPKGTATRAEVAVMIMRYGEKVA